MTQSGTRSILNFNLPETFTSSTRTWSPIPHVSSLSKIQRNFCESNAYQPFEELLNHGRKLLVITQYNRELRMNYRKFVAAAVVVASSLLASPAVYAATSVNSPVLAMFGKSKTIKLTFLNDTGSPMEVKAGEEIIKLESGKPTVVNLAPGTRIVSATATEKHEAGSLIAEVTSQLNGATIHIK